MARMIYGSITSLDGYIEDESGSFDWSAPDEEVHAFVNDSQRQIGTFLYGRRLYDTMKVWDTLVLDDEPAVMADYASLWRAADKIVYSTSLQQPETERTRIEPRFDVAAVAQLKAAATSDLIVGGAELAAQALVAGLVDEVHQYLSPVIVGGGKHFLPNGWRATLELLEERRFGNGVVFLRYAMA